MLDRKFLLASTVALGALVLSPSAMATPNGVKVGILTCNVEGGWGYILGSSKDLSCTYHPNHSEDDRYVGSISKFGVDIGYTSSGTLVWDVIAPTSDVRPGALQGDYGGATASATVAAGVGANVLFGGFDKSIALQPISFESNSGLDVAAGIGELNLREARPVPTPVASLSPAQLPPDPPLPRVAAIHTTTFMVSFDFDKATLTYDARKIVSDAANNASRERLVRILVTGHADRVGTDDYNQHLSWRRAEAVKVELVRDGFDARLISVSGRGFLDPVVQTAPGVRDRENRVVVIELRADGEPRQASR